MNATDPTVQFWVEFLLWGTRSGMWFFIAVYCVRLYRKTRSVPPLLVAIGAWGMLGKDLIDWVTLTFSLHRNGQLVLIWSCLVGLLLAIGFFMLALSAPRTVKRDLDKSP